MLEYVLPTVQGFSVKYSPFFDNRIAVAGSQNFGMAGNGGLYLLELTDQGIKLQREYHTQDCVFDISHSEANPNQIAASCGDGSVKVYDVTNPEQFPVIQYREHTREVFGCSWNLLTKRHFATSSWDGFVKIWDPERQQSVRTLPIDSCTYSVQWSPHTDGLISTVSSDSHLRLFDLRTPAGPNNHLVFRIPVHGQAPAKGGQMSQIYPPSECLAHDWNKYRPGVIATGSIDRLIRTFDIRMPNGARTVMHGHQYGIRRLTWSPHKSDILMSCGYDMTVRIWSDVAESHQATGSLEIAKMNEHSEFVTGVDWCLFGAEGWAASCAWDSRVLVWDVREFMPR